MALQDSKLGKKFGALAKNFVRGRKYFLRCQKNQTSCDSFVFTFLDYKGFLKKIYYFPNDYCDNLNTLTHSHCSRSENICRKLTTSICFFLSTPSHFPPFPFPLPLLHTYVHYKLYAEHWFIERTEVWMDFCLKMTAQGAEREENVVHTAEKHFVLKGKHKKDSSI